ncbi:MAG: hypothetical protein PVI90_19645 [Desulfobacteraceae bacterium]
MNRTKCAKKNVITLSASGKNKKFVLDAEDPCIAGQISVMLASRQKIVLMDCNEMDLRKTTKEL